jgi:hypothetical protein
MCIQRKHEQKHEHEHESKHVHEREHEHKHERNIFDIGYLIAPSYIQYQI